MGKQFLVSVGDARFYDSNDNLVITAKTLMDSGIEVAVGESEVRGGKGNPVQYILSHGASMNLTLSETQFSLPFLQENLGSTLATGANIFSEETVTLAASAVGTIVGTPLAYQTATTYAWVTHSDGSEERLAFSGQTFTSVTGAEGDVVCVLYYNLDAAAQQVTVAANVIPSILRVEIDTQLADSSDSANIIGSVRFTIPRLKLSGNFTLTMTPDSVSETPMTGKALAYSPTSGSCANVDVLGYITKVVTSANWYDDVVGLAIQDGDISLTHPDTKTIVVWAVHSTAGSTPSIAPVADLTYASDTVGTATIASAVITTVAVGTTTVSASITAKPSIDANVIVTVG